MKKRDQKIVRVAIYSRVSSDEGLGQAYNSLHAQKDCCGSYIRSQASEGWVLTRCYEDGGFSGGTMRRPGLQQLLADIEAGRIDLVLTYKMDRWSRCLMHFFTMLEVLERKGVGFVSATQPINTSTPAGRLFVHMLMSFAEFERELVSERTRDKIALSRRRGKWPGGRPPLGYVINRASKRLEIDPDEAERVRGIFGLYLEHRSVMAVVKELARRGWRTKAWVTSGGKPCGDRPFDKNNLILLLTNVIYIGRVRHKDQTYTGEHDAIVIERTFQRVQELLKSNGRTGGLVVRNKHGALLKGLLHCASCGCSMGHTYTSKRGRRVRYSYYVCSHAQKRGWDGCPSPSVPASAIEASLVENIRGMVDHPQLITETVRQARIQGATISRQEVVAAFARFDELWATLEPHEQVHVVRLLVQRVDWDGRAGVMRISFHDTGLSDLAKADQEQEAA